MARASRRRGDVAKMLAEQSISGQKLAPDIFRPFDSSGGPPRLGWEGGWHGGPADGRGDGRQHSCGYPAMTESTQSGSVARVSRLGQQRSNVGA